MTNLFNIMVGKSERKETLSAACPCLVAGCTMPESANRKALAQSPPISWQLRSWNLSQNLA
jgi:hypothetical protein